MAGRNTICVVGPEEAALLKQNIQPHCPDHYHIRRAEAMEMTSRGDFKPYFTPIAEWVGPHHIRILQVHAIRGLSCKVGEFLEAALRSKNKRDWAMAMLAQMQQRREPPCLEV